MKIPLIIFAITMMLITSSCEKIDNQRIPGVAVNIELNNDGLWNTYGVHSYGEYRIFIKSEGVPGNYSYTAATFTGYGGILLISGFDADTGDYNAPLAYDLACPVEAKSNIRVSIDKTTNEAVCPKCGSHYNVCEGQGTPLSGKAVEYKYGMQKYHAYHAQLGGYYISR
ncbi:MAG: hypothetical protein RR938_04040 [Muribaculaceae bacterium]